jgi:PAS domain S-box-containing protein
MGEALQSQDRLSGKLRSPWAWYGILGLALVAIFPFSTSEVQSFVYDLTGVLGVGAVFWGAGRRAKDARRPWYLIGFGLLAWAIADIAWHGYEFLGTGTPSFPAPMDVMYVIGYPLIGAGLLLLTRAKGLRGNDSIDSAIIAVGVGAVAWVFLGAPYVNAAGYSGLQLVAALAYPAGDALLLGAVVRMLFVGERRSVSLRLVIASMALLIVTDGLYLQESLLGSYVAGGWLDLGWLLSYVAIGVAALHPSVTKAPSRERIEERKLSLGRLSFAISLPILGPALFMAQLIAGVHVNLIVIGCSIATLFVLSMARARGVVVSFNDHLTRLDAQNESLEKAFVELSEKEAALRFQAHVLDEVESFVVVVGADAKLTYVNAYAERYFGWTNEDLAGRVWTDVFGDLDTSDLADIADALGQGDAWEGDVFIPVQDAKRVVRVAVSPMRDGAGNQTGTVCIGHDVTQGRELEDRLRRAQKLEAFGQLAGGVAHDFNNLLAVVLNYSKFLVEDLPEDDERREDAKEIVKAGERGASLTRQLLTFSRKSEGKPESVLLNDVVEEMGKMLSRTIPENVRFTVDLAEDLSSTMIDPGHMEQIIMNLVVNARDAIPDGGHMRLKTGNKTLEAVEASALGIAAGSYVTFSVSDDGIGIDDETLVRIFEPFFTTKAVGKGTGLGLATVYGIVQEANGAIEVHSVLGEGAEFVIYLPASTHESQASTQITLEPTPQGNGERIIVTEDEKGVRDLVCRMLRRNGYAVTSYASSELAATEIESGVASADLLLTDVVMPGLSGFDLAMRAGLPTLLMTGYSNLDAKRIGALPTLTKPFDERQLARAVRSALERAVSTN